MERRPLFNEGFALNLGTKTAICLGRLCKAEMGEGCGLSGVSIEIDQADPTSMTAERICSLPEAECPGTTLIEEAAYTAIAQIAAEQN